MKILWLKTELLHPVDKGGKIRTYQMLRRLKRDHEVTYLTLSKQEDGADAVYKAAEYCDELVMVPWQEAEKFSARFYGEIGRNIFSPLPYAIQKYRSIAMKQAIEREMEGNAYDLLVCDFLAPTVNLPRKTRCARLLFQHNVEAMIWKRHYEMAAGLPRRLYLYGQWQKMQRYERNACRRFDAVVAVSDADRDLMRTSYGARNVYAVPTGVDTEFFKPLGLPRNPLELVFTGSMDWLPNEDAILFFAEKILPRITAECPGVTLNVVGRNPTRRLRALADTNASVRVTGRVDDIRPYVDAAAVYVVPLRIGGGTRLKIYEAMAMGKPVISTSVGAEGLPVVDGEQLLISDEPDEFARAVINVLQNSGLTENLGRQARRVVTQRFGWEHAADAFGQICERVTLREENTATRTSVQPAMKLQRGIE